MIAVSLNVGGGVRLIIPAKLYMCTQKHYKHNEDGRTAPGVRQWFRTAEPLGERRYENWNTHTRLLLYRLSIVDGKQNQPKNQLLQLCTARTALPDSVIRSAKID